jgi:hypothetical protein
MVRSQRYDYPHIKPPRPLCFQSLAIKHITYRGHKHDGWNIHASIIYTECKILINHCKSNMEVSQDEREATPNNVGAAQLHAQ